MQHQRQVNHRVSGPGGRNTQDADTGAAATQHVHYDWLSEGVKLTVSTVKPEAPHQCDTPAPGGWRLWASASSCCGTDGALMMHPHTNLPYTCVSLSLSLLLKEHEEREVEQRRCRAEHQRRAGSHLSPGATSPQAAMMCSLIGGADEVWWGRYLLNSRACYLDNAGEWGVLSHSHPFSALAGGCWLIHSCL